MSQGIGAWIAQLAFWALLLLGISFRELDKRWAVVFVALWLAGYVGLPGISWFSALFPSYVAALDIALVFIVFKGDVRLT